MSRGRCRLTVACVAALAAAALSRDAAADDASKDHGWTLRIDDDFLALAERDADYTGGFAYTLNDDGPVGPRWLGRALDWIDDALRAPRDGTAASPRAFEIGVQLFTPRDLTAEEALPDDRPYANLVYASTSSLTRDEARDVVRQTTFTIGVLGLPITGDLHRALHELLQSPLPNGYAHQISDGGEPTFRYAFSSQHLLASGTLGERPYSARFGFTANAGYLTDASAEIAIRSGPERVPWWSAPPPLSDYAGQPPMRQPSAASPRGVVVEGGLAVRARAYNAFLQGQVRHSDVTFAWGELNHLLLEAWFGISAQREGGLAISYSLRWQSPEIAAGIGSRSFAWGTLSFARGFR
ncbi:MAG TPA: lipid A-modifier LpxR family protein [Gammaproteobacteria bacterium]|nr:lipid A-modifier LpxR family protein [Gammaproteobacteria bacterium]